MRDHPTENEGIQPKGKARRVIDIDLARREISYCPETGALTWLPRGVSSFDGRLAGKPALSCKNTKGYGHGSYRGIECSAHVIAWMLHYGSPPTGPIDHINGDPADNRISNLRCVTPAINARNRKATRAKGSVVPGIKRSKGFWSAHIGRRGYLGSFTCFGQAVRQRKKAEAALGYTLRMR